MKPFHGTCAVFDLDDSLVGGNCGTILTRYLYLHQVIRPRWRHQIYRHIYDYALKRIGEAEMVELGSRCHDGVEVEELRAAARRCFEQHIRKRITREGYQEVRRHLLEGHLVVVASGSPSHIVEEVGAFLGAHIAIGTRTEIQDGVVSGEIRYPIPFRDGKRILVEEVFERFRIELARTYLYTDSRADLPLLELVGHPVLVNPNEELRRLGLHRGWPVEEWRELLGEREQPADQDELEQWPEVDS